MPADCSVLNPVPLEDFSSHHLGMLPHHQQSRQPSLAALYQKSTSAFLLRQYDAAYATCVEGLEVLANGGDITRDRGQWFLMRQRLWVLYVTIVGATMAEGDIRKKASGTEKHKNGFSEKVFGFLSKK